MAEQYNDAVEKLKDPKLWEKLQNEAMEQRELDKHDELRRELERVSTDQSAP